MIYCLYSFVKEICIYKVDLGKIKTFDTTKLSFEEVGTFERRLSLKGRVFYAAQPAMLWFGFYRLYPVIDFMNLLLVNYVAELFLQTLPLTLIIMQANS